jgi:SUMO ligase MMS21 Smc5/6 complex component
LEQQKERLVKTAEVNVEQQRQIQAFVSGLQRVQQTLLQQGQHEEKDYSEVLAEEMKKAKDEQAAEQLEMHQEPLVRAMQTTLCMKVSAASGGNESDNDVEVMPTGSTAQGLKCPISLSYFADPVKSKVCGHVYSKDFLRQLLDQHGHRGMACPISGCVNRHLTMETCQPDRITQQKVNRHLRNQAAAEEVRMSQAVDLDLMDDEEEEF